MGLTCKKCGKTEPEAEFYKDRRMTLGYASTCKACKKLQQKDFNKKYDALPNKEEIQERLDAKYKKKIISGNLIMEGMIVAKKNLHGFVDISLGLEYVYINKKQLKILHDFIGEQL